MAITINGTGSITGLSAGGLPDGSVTAGDLAASLDLSSKTLTLPSGTANKVLQTVQLYQSSSRVAFSGESNVQLGSTGFRYINSAKIGGAITKISSTSHVLIIAFYSAWVNTSNWHDTVMWCAENSDYRHLGFDSYRMAGSTGTNRTNHTFTQLFTGLGTGTRTFYICHGTGDSRSNGGVLNYNPMTDISTGDTWNTPTTSQVIAMEIEP